MTTVTEYVWSDTYTRAVHLFDGQTPGRDLEASLVEQFERQPEAVIAAVEKLGERFAAGRVRSPWPLVLRELDQVDRASIRADGKAERALRVRQAEAWIRNAGLHAPTEAECVDELFESRQALLTPWAADDVLRQRMCSLWRELRPIGEQIDRDLAERMAPPGGGGGGRGERVAGVEDGSGRAPVAVPFSVLSGV